MKSHDEELSEISPDMTFISLNRHKSTPKVATPVPQFDLVFIGHPLKLNQQDHDWPGTPFVRTQRDFSQSDPDSKTITVVLNHQLYGGIYTKDLNKWIINPAETRVCITITGERILTTLKPPLLDVTPPEHQTPEPSSTTEPLAEHPASTSPQTVETPMVQPNQSHAHCYEELPRVTTPGRGSSLAFLETLFTNYEGLTTPNLTFTACLEKQFEGDPPMTIFKHASPGDPRYYLGVPHHLRCDKRPNVVLHLSSSTFTYLYRCRVSGIDRHGIYNYIKKANHTVGTWLPDPDNGDWLLLGLGISKYIRENFLLAFLNENHDNP
jgi:hypothetical protein